MNDDGNTEALKALAQSVGRLVNKLAAFEDRIAKLERIPPLRDLLAMSALTGLIAHHTSYPHAGNADDDGENRACHAANAYRYADAMLKAREMQHES